MKKKSNLIFLLLLLHLETKFLVKVNKLVTLNIKEIWKV